MRKNIALIINSISSDYSVEFIKGVSNYLKNKDANLIISQVQLPDEHFGIFEYQYWAGMKLLESECIDAIIVVTPIFVSKISIEKLSRLLEPISNKPIISISVPLLIPNSYCIKISSKSIYKKIVKHLKEEHSCKRFAFMAANSTGSAESYERFEAYKYALQENDLTYDPDLLFDGRFVAAVAYDSLKQKIKSKKDINFDAIICANDGMAFGSILFMNELGVRIPEEVKIIGYDDVTDAEISSLTTINQNIEGQASKAAELALRILSGEKTPSFVEVKPKIVYRTSCGCTHSDERQKFIMSSQNLKFKVSNLKDVVYYLFDSIQTQISLEVLSDSFVDNLSKENFHMLSICLYDEPVLITKGKPFDLPQEVNFKFLIDKEKENSSKASLIPEECKRFSIKEKLLPNQFLNSGNNIFMLHPIFYAYNQFGYMLAKIASDDFVLVQIFMKAYSNLISQSYLYTNSLNKNILLESQKNALFHTAHTDELTGVLNRRGLYERGQKLIDESILNGQNGFVVFGDMDHLKYINDTFGHDFGDIAIKTEAEILLSSFRNMDVIGRLGGDEFAIIIPGLPKRKVIEIKEKIRKNAKILSKEKNLPFEISISLGEVEFNSENSNLKELLSYADKILYMEKRRRSGVIE